MIDLLKYRYLYFLISAIIIIPGVVCIAIGGLKPGIDFTGGTEITVALPAKAPSTAPTQIETIVRAVSFKDASGRGQSHLFDDNQVQGASSDPKSPFADRQQFLIRTRDIGSNVPAQDAILGALKAHFGAVQEVGINTVGPTIGAQTTQRAAYAVIAAAVAILLYIAFAFRHLTHPFVYGTAAIIALLHDVLVVLGLFAIMGYFFNVRIDALFVPAVLTVIGFSVHDTIVVFDRVRENVGRRTGEPYYTVVNNSLAQTIGRSLNTSITVLLTLMALVLFGGESIHVFVLTLLIGIVSGTYSSIFNATPLAVIWETGELGRLFGRGSGDATGGRVAVRPGR